MNGENWPKFNGTGNNFYIIDKSDIKWKIIVEKSSLFGIFYFK